MTVHEDKWLSEVLGRPSFRVDLPKADEDSFREVDSHQRGREAAFYFAKIETGEVDQVRLLGRAGFFVVDVNVTFELTDPARLSSTDLPVEVGEVTSASKGRVLHIAGSCFRYSRFHLDPLVPAALAHRMKREWIHNYIEKKRGDHLFIAYREGRPAGFLASLLTENNGRSTAVIDLVGVAEEDQKRRVGESLVTAFVQHYQATASSFIVGTQVANIPSVRLYEKLGFTLKRSQYVLHMHRGPAL